MKFKNSTIGEYKVRNIKHTTLIKLYCVFADVYVNGSWITLSFTEDGILNINKPDSKFNLVKDES